MTTVAIVQARMGSTRLPNKVMRPIGGTPMIGVLLERLSRAKRVDRIIVATSTDARNAPLAAFVRGLGYGVFEGSEDDVLDRYCGAAQEAGADTVIRITGDCPLVDPLLVDQVVDLFEKNGARYASNVQPATFPDGLDIEVFSREVLEQARREASSRSDREHVTPFIRRLADGDAANLANAEDYSNLRWT